MFFFGGGFKKQLNPKESKTFFVLFFHSKKYLVVRKEKEGQKIQEIWQRFAQEIYREKRFKGYEKERWKIWKEEQKRQKIWWTRRKEIQREKSRKERQEKEVLNINIIIKLMVILSLLLIDHQSIDSIINLNMFVIC